MSLKATGSRERSLDELRSALVPNPTGSPVRIGDLAQVSEREGLGPDPAGRPAVCAGRHLRFPGAGQAGEPDPRGVHEVDLGAARLYRERPAIRLGRGREHQGTLAGLRGGGDAGDPGGGDRLRLGLGHVDRVPLAAALPGGRRGGLLGHRDFVQPRSRRRRHPGGRARGEPGDPAGGCGAGDDAKRGAVPAMLDAAIAETRASWDVADKYAIKERVAARLDRIELAVGRDINRGTGVLATIGSTAPFVGLFGTVWGIMNSFIGISEAQTTNLAIVAPGIAEALLATAFGLVAAIPAVIVYNHFARAIGGYKALVGDAAVTVLGPPVARLRSRRAA